MRPMQEAKQQQVAVRTRLPLGKLTGTSALTDACNPAGSRAPTWHAMGCSKEWVQVQVQVAGTGAGSRQQAQAQAQAQVQAQAQAQAQVQAAGSR